MELTQECYRDAEIAYRAYCTQAGWKSLETGDPLPMFDKLPLPIKDAWAAVAVSLDIRAHGLAYQSGWNDAINLSVNKLTEAAELSGKRCNEALVKNYEWQRLFGGAQFGVDIATELRKNLRPSCAAHSTPPPPDLDEEESHTRNEEAQG